MVEIGQNRSDFFRENQWKILKKSKKFSKMTIFDEKKWNFYKKWKNLVEKTQNM